MASGRLDSNVWGGILVVQNILRNAQQKVELIFKKLFTVIGSYVIITLSTKGTNELLLWKKILKNLNLLSEKWQVK